MASDTADSAETRGAAVRLTLPVTMDEKIGRIGGVDVLENLKHTNGDLRIRGYPLPKADKRVIPNH